MSARNLIKSFHFALQGIVHALTSQRNMRIHFTAALLVMLFSLVLGVNRWEALILFIAITLVIITELFNTAIEAIVDMATAEFHPLAKVAKDVAAGAVFLTSGLAIAVGITVFIPYLYAPTEQVLAEKLYNPNVGAVFMLGLVMFGTIFLKAVAHYREWRVSPSLTTALAVSIVFLVWVMTLHLIVSLLVTILCLLLVGSRLRIQPEWAPILWGAVAGSLMTLVGLLFA